jgi:hypothetical protein
MALVTTQLPEHFPFPIFFVKEKGKERFSAISLQFKRNLCDT